MQPADSPRGATCSWYPERREQRPCADCGGEIVPGQLYVIDGPLHVYCGDHERRTWNWYAAPTGRAGGWPG